MTKIRRTVASAALLSLLGVASFAQAANPVTQLRNTIGSNSFNASEFGDFVNSTLFLSWFSDQAGIDVTSANSGYHSLITVNCSGVPVTREKWAVGGGSPFTDNIVFCTNPASVSAFLEVLHGDP
jgi:hypothetical protein